jgi:hypothetical protein
VVVVLWAVGAAAAAGLVGTPYDHVAEALLDHLHAERVPCPVAVGDATVCFVVDPARAAPLAEALDAFVVDHAGALAVGPWRSGNGAHQVTLHWANDLWGGLEVWFAEHGASRVEGRFEYVVKRRD